MYIIIQTIPRADQSNKASYEGRNVTVINNWCSAVVVGVILPD